MAAGFAVLAAQPHASAGPGCQRITVKGEVKAGDAFAQEIGGGLALRLTPEAYGEPAAGESKGPDGWRLTLEPSVARQDHGQFDRIYPVNPPLRFNPWQDIGTSYGIAAKEKLREPITYRFVLSDTDYAEIDTLLQAVLWPNSAPDPEHADEDYLSAVEGLDTGLIRFRPTQYDLSDNGERIRRLAFAVEITAPQNFAFVARLAPEPAPCPPKGD